MSIIFLKVTVSLCSFLKEMSAKYPGLDNFVCQLFQVKMMFLEQKQLVELVTQNSRLSPFLQDFDVQQECFMHTSYFNT